MKTKYTKEILLDAIQKSNSINDVLRVLGLKCLSGNHAHISKIIKDYNLNISNFNLVRKYKPPVNKKSADDILISSNNKVKSQMVKRALLEKGILYNCEACGISDSWQNKKIVLQIDHIDGNNMNNLISNLRFLCPNCHSQTDTFNKKKNVIQYKCLSCNSKMFKNSKLCQKCFIKIQKINQRKVKNRPSKEELFKMLWERPTTEIAKQYKISDKSVEKWAKSYGIAKPPRGYWSKNKD